MVLLVTPGTAPLRHSLREAFMGKGGLANGNSGESTEGAPIPAGLFK